MKMHLLGIVASATLALPLAATAEEFRTVKDQDTFINAVSGKKLTRFGIKLDVLPSGEIRGSAFGAPVTGAWRWDDSFFCRDLSWGDRNLGPNCQMVKINGDTVRFIADQGAGQYADLKLE